METPMEMFKADLIEHDIEELIYYIEDWIFAGNELTDEIKKFVDFCSEKQKHKLHASRSGDGKSFYQRREEASDSRTNSKVE